MKKNLYFTMYTLLLVTVLASCSSSETPNYAIEGEWAISQKYIECSNAALAKEINAYFNEAVIKKGKYEYVFGEGLVPSDPNDPTTVKYQVFSENTYVKEESGGYASDKSLKGGFVYNTNNRGLTIQLGNIGLLGNWNSTGMVIDINKDYLAIKQPLTSDDLAKLLSAYFNITRHLDGGLTGVMTTKAVRIKE